jgi:hypothetical protein
VRSAARRILTLALAVILAASCSSDDADGPRVVPPERAQANLPAKLLGLQVVEEDVSKNVSSISRTYLQSVGLFSFREGDDLLRATLQIGKFNDVAENDKERFRDSIIGQLGSSVPLELRMGKKKVFVAAGGEQNIYTWFDDLGFYALSVRSDYPFPRTMVRKLLNLEILA